MKRFESLNDLLGSLSDIELGQSLYFVDDDFNKWLLEVEEDWIAIDDSIPEDDLTYEDLEFYPRSKLSIQDSYLSFTSSDRRFHSFCSLRGGFNRYKHA